MKGNTLTLVTAGMLVVSLGLYGCSFSVSAGSVAVVKTLGAISSVESTPGLYFKAPWPFQSVTSLDTRSRVLTIPGSEVLSSDKFNLLVTISLGWHIKEQEAQVRDFFKTSQGSIENSEQTLSSRVRSARKQVLNATKLGTLISTDKSQLESFKAFETKIKSIVQKGLDEAGYGLEIDFLYVQNIRLPKDVTEKVFERMAKERERVSQRYLARGRNQAKIIRDNALSERDKKLAEAEAKAIRIRGKADAEIADAYRVFEKYSALALWLRKTETLRRILNQRSTLILPTEDALESLIPKAPKITPPEKIDKIIRDGDKKGD